MKRNPITIAVGALLLLIFVLLLFLFQVRKTELAVVTTFGRVSSQAGPGAHFRWPWPIQSVHKFDQRIHNFESKFEQVLTSDGNNLLIMVYVGWQINDSAVFLTIESIQDGSWKGGGNATFGLKEDGVGLGKVSPKVPQEDVDEVDEIKQQIADGEINAIPTEVGKS